MESHAIRCHHPAGAPHSTLVSLILLLPAVLPMQILFLAHRIPYPPDKGERIRAFHELRYLAAQHEVDLFCFADSAESAENEKRLRGLCRSVHVEVVGRPVKLLHAARNFLAGRPVSFGFFESRKFSREVQQALQRCRYDVVFVYCSSMGQSLPQATQAPIVVDFVDADSQKFTQYAARSGPFVGWLFAREARKVAAAEQRLGRIAAQSFAVTGHDARELRGSGPSDFEVEVIPNGVQVPDPSESQSDPQLLGIQPYAVFVGTMNYLPNSDAAAYFARDILPLVRKSHPNLRFVVVGRDPARRVRDLSAIPGVLVMGTVPDTFQYLRNAHVSVAPFRISQGFHNKIAESLAVGTPVITTSRAMAGIGLSEREGLFVADTAEKFADKVTMVLNDVDLRRELRDRAPAVRQQLSWDVRLRRLEQLILQVAGRPVASPEFVAGH